MNCQVCGKPASVVIGRKEPEGYCPDHAEWSGLIPPAGAQAAWTPGEARRAFVAFLQTHRRVPTARELHDLGVLDARLLNSAEHVEFWTRYAEAILAEDQPGTPGPLGENQ